MLNPANLVFSIVITTHNRPQFLRKALESLVQQGFQHWEAHVIDDGSETNYWQGLLLEYQDPRIKGWTQSHQGVNAARNLGIDKSQGEFLLFLDDDDLYLPMHLEVLYVKIKKYSPRYKIFKTGIKAMRPGKGFQPDNLSTSDPLLEIYRQGENLLSFAFHRAVFETLRFVQPPILAADQLFLLEAVLAFPLKVLQVPTVVYHWNPQGLSKNYSEESLRIGEDFFEWASPALHLALRMRLGYAYKDCYWGKFYLHHARLAIQQDKHKDFRKLLGKAWHYRKFTPPKEYLRTLYTFLRR